jgi:hypothetical protein
MIFRYIGGKEGGLDKLKGKTIGYIFFDGGYGREPLPLLHQFAKTMVSRSRNIPSRRPRCRTNRGCGLMSVAIVRHG